jgi:hypothetical protein
MLNCKKMLDKPLLNSKISLLLLVFAISQSYLKKYHNNHEKILIYRGVPKLSSI